MHQSADEEICHDSMDGVHHWRYSEYHMEEKQVGERQQNNPNAIMFREDARFRNQRAVAEAAERFPRWVKRKKWICSGTRPVT